MSIHSVDREARTAALIAQHGTTLLRVARRVSLCADDAHDALQRALEIYLRRLATLDPATEVAWMRVVVRNEALAVRRARGQLVHGEEADLDAQVGADQRSLEERVESAERVTRSAEALRELKPDEARALLLKAEGLSYDEIGQQLGWTYTKVNRCITEGRARFRKAFRGIESGEQCERFAPLLITLIAGEADADALVRLKPHLRHCVACRADVRRLHGSRWPQAAAWLPVPGFLERLKPGSLKAELYGLLHRLGADPVASAVAGTGGGRGAGATALVGLCLAGASAGGYCAVGGPLPDLPVAAVRDAAPREAQAPASAPAPAAVAVAATATATPQATRTPVAAPAPERRTSRKPTRTPQSTSAQVNESSDEFFFEAASAATPAPTAAAASTPAPAPAATPAAPAAPRTEPVAADSAGGEFGFER